MALRRRGQHRRAERPRRVRPPDLHQAEGQQGGEAGRGEGPGGCEEQVGGKAHHQQAEGACRVAQAAGIHVQIAHAHEWKIDVMNTR